MSWGTDGDLFHIDADIRLAVVNIYLTDGARRLLVSRPDTAQLSYEEAVEVILKTYKLSPGRYREMFQKSSKRREETYVQFVNRVKVLLQYYTSSRKVDNNYERLFHLLISDHLKSTVPYFM